MKNLKNPYIIGILIAAILVGYFVGKKYGTGWGIFSGIMVPVLAFVYVLFKLKNSKCFMGDC